MKNSIFFLLLFYGNVFGYSLSQKQKYLYPLGEKIYHLNAACQELQKHSFLSYGALYDHIVSTCQLKQKRYNDAVALFLWERKKISFKHLPKLQYTKKTKCPICGMFIYKYPAWATMMEVGKKRYYFDGVKDMLKYYFQEKLKNPKMYVQDYYTKKIFELHKGYLVVGSDIYGPMGDELIPFLSKKMAEKFLFDHKGVKIYSFDQVKEKDVFALDQ